MQNICVTIHCSNHLKEAYSRGQPHIGFYIRFDMRHFVKAAIP
ncbi:hypothetical protein T07_11540 [Trichinella nelsoni]|uniref:Uncharacterized protein n=1 Tax=Trichinella nelsoni TaxID=6336 RepID=A0A0V0RAI9_9BILA|nr:hypothetical protein T07_11540 [Trichinella nelsoni]